MTTTIRRRALVRAGLTSAVATGSVSVLAGCGASGNSPRPTSVNYPTTLVFQPFPNGLGNVATSFQIMQRVLAPFEQKNRVNVKLALWPGTASNLSAIAGGVGPDVLFDNRYASYLESGLLLNLSPLLQQDGIKTSIWSKGQVDYFQRPQGLFAVPSTVETMCYIVNLSDFDAAGLPYPDPEWTMDQFAQLAGSLTRTSSSGTHYGADFCIRWGHVQGYQWFFNAFGGSINNASGTQCTLTSAGSVAAGNWLFQKLIWPGVSVTRNSARLAGEWDAAMLLQGQVTMATLAPTEILEVLSGISSSVKWMLYPFPLFPQGRMGWASEGFFGINGQTQYKEAAWELLKFLTVQPTWQQALIQLNFTGPSLTELWNQWAATAEQLAPILHNKGLQWFVDPVQQGYAIPGTFFKYNDVNGVTPLLTSTFTNLASQTLTSVETAFATVQTQVNQIQQQGAASSSGSSASSATSA